MDRHVSAANRRLGASSSLPVAIATTMLLLLSLAACGGAGTGAPTDAASVRPTPTAEPSMATPEPTPDVLAAFHERLARDEISMVASFEGIYTIEDVQRAEGTYTRNGADFVFEQTTHLPSGGDQQMHVAFMDGQIYVRAGQLWIASDSAPSRVGLAAALKELEYELAGTEELEDGVGYVLRSEDADLLPVMLALNLADGLTEEPSGSVELVVTPDGEVAVIRVDSEHVQMGTPLEMSVEFVVQERGPQVKLPPVDDPWEMWTSEHFPYRIGRPTAWYAEHWEADAEFPAADMLLSGDNRFVEVYYTPDGGAAMEPPLPTDTVTAGMWLAFDADILAEMWGVPVEDNEPLTVGGLEGRVYSMHVDDPAEGPLYHMYAAVFRGPDAFELRWFSDPGDEEADALLFAQMLATFGVTE